MIEKKKLDIKKIKSNLKKNRKSKKADNSIENLLFVFQIMKIKAKRKIFIYFVKEWSYGNLICKRIVCNRGSAFSGTDDDQKI